MNESTHMARWEQGGEVMRKHRLAMLVGFFAAMLLALGLMAPAAFAYESPFTVYYTVNGSDPIVAKEYSQADLEKLSQAGSLGYMYYKENTYNIKGSSQYVTIDDLLKDALGKKAGVYWNENSTLSVTTGDLNPYNKGSLWSAGSISYSTYTKLNANGKFFPATTSESTSTDGALSVPVILSLKTGQAAVGGNNENAGDALTEAIGKASADSTFFVGTTEDEYKDTSNMPGNRFPSGVTAITVNYTTPDFAVTWTLDGEKVGSKALTSDELDALKKTGKLGYMQSSGAAIGSAKAATEYATVESILSAALGDNFATYWKEGSKLSVSCQDGAYTKGPWGNGGMEYSTFVDLNKNGKFFPETTAKTVSTSSEEDAPIIVAYKYASQSMKDDTSAGAARDEAAGKAVADAPIIYVGVTKEGMADPGTNAAGNRFPGGVTEFTVNARNKYDIKFESNGGTSVATQNGYFGDKIEKPAEPTREGYTFDGWFTDKELTTALDVESYTIPKGGATIYAKWSYASTSAMHRLYNPNSGEHFYTANDKEFGDLVALGWQDEGAGWTAPEKSDTPVYRLYNPNAGEHHYTMDPAERDMLVNAGWNDEGIGWYSDDAKGQVLFREYNPNQFSCNHNYTTNKDEHDWLIGLGWRDEGTAWYGLAAE